MQRRTFLMAAATAMAIGPSWLRRAFADASLGGRRTMRGALAAARERARVSGKPILVLVIPANPEEVDRRGVVLGGWLDGGVEEELVPLALCEVVCATMAEVGEVGSRGEEPLLVLLDGNKTVSLRAKLPADDYANDDRQRAIINGRVATLAGWTRREVMGPKILPERAKMLWEVLPKEELAPIEKKLARGELPSLAETDRAAALVAMAAGKDPRLQKQLADSVAARWEAGPPKGSHWAHYANCAEEVEAEGMQDLPETHSVGCGMGSIPPRSQRFLYFWTKPPRMLAKEEGGR
jgi:hypothetical protein